MLIIALAFLAAFLIALSAGLLLFYREAMLDRLAEVTSRPGNTGSLLSRLVGRRGAVARKEAAAAGGKGGQHRCAGLLRSGGLCADRGTEVPGGHDAVRRLHIVAFAVTDLILCPQAGE